MNLLIFLSGAILGISSGFKYTFYQVWIFFACLCFALYAAFFAAPTLGGVLPGIPGYGDVRVPAVQLIVTLLLVSILLKITDSVFSSSKSAKMYPLPPGAERLGTLIFSALAGILLLSIILLPVSALPFVRTLEKPSPLEMSLSARDNILRCIRTVNALSLQGGMNLEETAAAYSLTVSEPSPENPPESVPDVSSGAKSR